MISCRRLAFAFLSGVIFSAGDLRAEDWAQWRGPMRTGHVPDGWRVPDHLPAQPKVVWQLKTGERFSSPVVSGGKVFYSDNVGGKETLHAVDATTGKEFWNVTIDDVHQDTQGPPAPRC